MPLSRLVRVYGQFVCVNVWLQIWGVFSVGAVQSGIPLWCVCSSTFYRCYPERWGCSFSAKHTSYTWVDFLTCVWLTVGNWSLSSYIQTLLDHEKHMLPFCAFKIKMLEEFFFPICFIFHVALLYTWFHISKFCSCVFVGVFFNVMGWV